MSSYLEALTADRERLRRALQGQIETEAAAVSDPQSEQERLALELDQKIVRLMIFRGLFGPDQQETLSVQVEVEEVAKPHALATQQLSYRQRVLQALQEALLRLEQTGGLDSPPATAGDVKLTVADI